MFNSSTSYHSFPEWTHFVSGTLILIASLFGIFGNAAIVITFKKHEKFHNTSNLFMITLNVCDFLSAVIAHPMVIISSFSQTWIFGDVGCKLYGFVVCSVSYTQVYMMVAIATERCRAILGKCLVSGIYSKKKTFAIISGCALHGLLWALMPVFGWSSYELEGLQSACSINWNSDDVLDISFSLALVSEMWIVPLAVITFSYIRIYMKLKSSGKSVTTQQVTSRLARERKVLKRCIIIVLTFIITWTPYAIVSVWTALAGAESIPIIVRVVPALSVKVYTLYSPFVYLCSNKAFREALTNDLPLIGKYLPKQKSRSDSGSTNTKTRCNLLRTGNRSHSPSTRCAYHVDKDQVLDKENIPMTHNVNLHRLPEENTLEML